MSIKAEWAYDFSCDQSLEEICKVFNDLGPWQWQMRESFIYGYYLNTRPAQGAHFRVHEYPQAFIKGRGTREEGFSALLRIESDSQLTKEDVDPIFRGLLGKVMAKDIMDIEPYD